MWPRQTASLARRTFCRLGLGLAAGTVPTLWAAPGTAAPAWAAQLDTEVGPAVPGVLLHVAWPERGLDWSGAAGVSDRATGAPLAPDQQFRIASVTKTFVAAAVLRLVEEGALALADPIGRRLAPAQVALLRRGGYDPERITVRHLLQHRSGLFDHSESENFERRIVADPAHRWTRTEQVAAMVEWGKPVGPPDGQFFYSDTGYVLLGEIVERAAGQSLDAALHRLLRFATLGLRATWIEGARPDRTEKRLHQYWQGQDTYAWDPSIDLYGGGGLLSTTRELTTFWLALFQGRVFARAETLATMLAPPPPLPAGSPPPKLDYRMGLWRIEFGGREAYTHTGYWGTQVVYVPTLGACLATNYSQVWPVKGPAPLLAKVWAQLMPPSP